MMRAALVTALCLATAAAWSRLELALQNYPRVHDRNLRGRALEEASRASGLGLPGDGITGARYGVERINCRELQRHGPMSRARGTVYVLGFNAMVSCWENLNATS